MFNISELHQASLLMDAAAVCLLAGTLIHTSIYRKRGHGDDILFFALNIITVIMAVSDGVTFALDGGTVPYGARISLLCNNVFFITFELFCGLLAVYLDYRIVVRKNIYTLKRGLVVMIPAIVMILLILANNFGRFLYWVDPATNEYFSYPMYNLVFLGPAIYAVFGMICVVRIDVKSLWIYILLLAVRLFFGQITQGVSSTALIFSMGLVFIHLYYMRLPFYDEEAL
ncbi:MAG: hypothetical protein K6B14_01410 [Lachnospiraceae bacterium]|nr:hypothetical protein [Lachnospiraceae bacterium]